MLIRPIAKRNGITLTIAASICIFSSITLLLITSGTRHHSVFFPLLAATLIMGICLLIIGITKLRDVYYRFSLTDEGIHYFTLRGGFTVLWEDIQRIDIPRINNGLTLIELPYVGLRLKQPAHLVANASLPTLSHMLMEQRVLIMLADPNANHYDNADNMLYPNIKITHKYHGLQAMFLNRMQYLHNTLGYDIYFPNDDFDRNPTEFVQLLRKFKLQCSK